MSDERGTRQGLRHRPRCPTGLERAVVQVAVWDLKASLRSDREAPEQSGQSPAHSPMPFWPLSLMPTARAIPPLASTIFGWREM